MTECERIIQSGRIPAEFLKEEVLCDFVVDQNRKKLWMILLDLLIEFDRVCKEHDLPYFLIGGSLLGAVRHDGFIPWDDDLDVGMLREDYEKLMKIGPSAFSEPYFFQTPYTDPGYGFSFIKIRNSNTSGISSAFRYESFNQGIFLDVFPYDACVPEEAEEHFHQINQLNLENSTYMRKSNPNPSDRDKARITAHSGKGPIQVYEEIQSIARKNESADSGYINLAVFTGFHYKKLIFPKHCFASFIEKSFENLTLPIPAGWEEMLQITYGDWTKFPPVEQRGAWHDGLFDPDIPYTEYIAKNWADAKTP